MLNLKEVEKFGTKAGIGKFYQIKILVLPTIKDILDELVSDNLVD